MAAACMTARPYELIDFGQERKLERFGTVVLDRPCPAARRPHRKPRAWQHADARFERRESGHGRWAGQLPEQWTVAFGRVVLCLKPNRFGHVGVFPEQTSSWTWLARHLASHPRPFKLLNLFAYTGASTLAAAAAGACVVHVDAARNIVGRARYNARLSELEPAPIRWIVEDATKFVTREIRRGNRYHGLVLDPPSYGHGPQGQPWKVDAHLRPLLESARQLLTHPPALLLLTCHSPGFDGGALRNLLSPLVPPDDRNRTETGRLSIGASAGGSLPCGWFARWSAFDAQPADSHAPPDN